MKSFLTENFLLQSKAASRLFHDYATRVPIIDYHSHLPPDEIASDKQFQNITKIWLDSDHYKWRAMRILGIEERFITGDATDHEKFNKWAYTVPYTMRNPLYHWTHLELKKTFGIDELLNPESAGKVYNLCNERLAEPGYSAQNLLKKMQVETVCTTDDPVDDLHWHEEIHKQNIDTLVLPTFRPDNAYAFHNPEDYPSYIQQLEAATDTTIDSLGKLLSALASRIDYFHERGCRLSDHGLERLSYRPGVKESDLERSYGTLLSGNPVSQEEADALTYTILLHLGRLYHEHGWTQQFHLGAYRNVNSRKFETLGPASGFDSIGDLQQSHSLGNFLNELDKTGHLSKTILYNLNPAHNAVMATMAGNFCDGSVRGKVQFGTAWWFLDQKDGMEEQMRILSNMGLLSCFIGMLTDSRSFLSYTRHEYFRRILCNMIGQDVENGELPGDLEWLGKLVQDICYHNARNYFGFCRTNRTQ